LVSGELPIEHMSLAEFLGATSREVKAIAAHGDFDRGNPYKEK